MASTRWLESNDALKNLLNKECFDESDVESDINGVQQGEDYNGHGIKIENWADMLARVNNNSSNPEQQQYHPLINHGDGDGSLPITTCTNAVTEGSSADGKGQTSNSNTQKHEDEA